MPRDVKRQYDGSRRQAQSATTRQRIVDAARRLMTDLGYTRTSLALVAAEAEVNVDTIYALIGRKPLLLRELVEQAISGTNHALTPDERDYVAAIRAEPDAEGKLRLYAAAVRQTQQRLAPIARVIREAAPSEPDVAALWNDITERRAANMHTFVADVAQASPLRPGLSVERAADIVWTLNSTDVYILLTEGRRWTDDEYERWLGESWARLLLA
jgi:AcrR family transcriptional regulator